MRLDTTDPVFIDITSGKVIQLRDDLFATQLEVLDPWLDKETLPEGVHEVRVNFDARRVSSIHIGDLTEWSGTTPGICIKQLFIYEHGGVSISTTAQCDWDTSTAGLIGVKADTSQQAEEYLDKIVGVWDDFLQFGRIDACFYDSLTELLGGGNSDDIMTVTPSLTQEEQVQEAAEYAALAKGHEWVPLKDAGSAVLKAVQAVVTTKNVDEMNETEVKEVLFMIKSWAAVI